MKTKVLFLSSALCMFTLPALCSECIDAECDASDVKYEVTEVYLDTDTGPEYVSDEVLTIEMDDGDVYPVPLKAATIDGRAPLWDGTNNKETITGHPRTVDWRDGAPVWDDSISNPRAKDFRDWVYEPLPETYLADSDDNSDVPDIQIYIEGLLAPKQPTEINWVPDTPLVDDGCPFDTEAECDIWRSKPIVRESVSPHSPKIRDDKMIEFLANLDCSGEIDANSDAAAPLVARYKMLMNSARACCTEGMAYALRNAGASDGLIYKFMSDDANFYRIGNRCLMTTDAELDAQYGNTATASVIADVRNGCLCRGREWFKAMLAPFVEAWNINPDFAASPFIWTYRDGLNRNITVSINYDVQNVLNQLTQCP